MVNVSLSKPPAVSVKLAALNERKMALLQTPAEEMTTLPEHNSTRSLFPKCTQFLRLARDCQIVLESRTARGRGTKDRRPVRAAPGARHCEERRLSAAAVNLSFASVIQRRVQVCSESCAVKIVISQCCRKDYSSSNPLPAVDDALLITRRFVLSNF